MLRPQALDWIAVLITWPHTPPTKCWFVLAQNLYTQALARAPGWGIPPSQSFLTCKLTLTICPLPTSHLNTALCFLPRISFQPFLFTSPEFLFHFIMLSNTLESIKNDTQLVEVSTSTKGQMIQSNGSCSPLLFLRLLSRGSHL